MKSLSQVSIRYLKEQKKRTLLTILGIIISVAMITSIGTMMYSMEQYELRSTIERNGYNHGAFVDIPKDQLQYVENNVNFSVVAKSILAGTGVKEDANGNHLSVELIGYEKEYLELRNMLPIEGRLPERRNEIVLESWKAKSLGIELGDEFLLSIGVYEEDGRTLNRGEMFGDGAVFREDTVESFVLVGLIESNGFSQAYRHSRGIVDLNWAEEVNNSDTITTIFRVKEGLDISKKISEVSAALELDSSKVQLNYNLIRREQGEISPELIAIAAFLIGLICVATVAVIYNAFHISVLERIKHFGVMRSIGTTPSQVRSLVFTEAGILSIISVPIGLAAGFYATKLLFFILSSGEFSSFQNLTIVTDPKILLGSSVIALVAVYLSALSPAISAGRVSPLDAIFKHRNLKKEAKTKKGYLLGKIFGSEGLLAYKNIQRNRKRMIITAFSISISVIMFIVFSVFSTYAFRINDNLFDYGADFELYTWGNDLFTEGELKEVLAIEGINQVVPLKESHVVPIVDQSTIKGPIKELMPEVWEKGVLYGSFLQGYNEEQMELAKRELREGLVDIDKLNAEKGVLLVLNSLYYDYEEQKNVIVNSIDIKVGETIYVITNEELIQAGIDPSEVESVENGLVSLKVMGILDKATVGRSYAHLGSFGIITTNEVYEQLTGKTGYNNIYVNLREDEDYGEVFNALDSIVNTKTNGRLFDRIANNRRDRQTVFEISVLIYGFITLISLIGVLNIINTISTNLLTRTKEFGMLRAVGMSPKSMRKMIRLEAVFSSITGAMFGLLLGNLLGYYLYTLINRYEGYAWEFPLNANIIALLATIIIALLAAIAPLRKIASLNIIETLREG